MDLGGEKEVGLSWRCEGGGGEGAKGSLTGVGKGLWSLCACMYVCTFVCMYVCAYANVYATP